MYKWSTFLRQLGALFDDSATNDSCEIQFWKVNIFECWLNISVLKQGYALYGGSVVLIASLSIKEKIKSFQSYE